MWIHKVMSLQIQTIISTSELKHDNLEVFLCWEALMLSLLCCKVKIHIFLKQNCTLENTIIKLLIKKMYLIYNTGILDYVTSEVWSNTFLCPDQLTRLEQRILINNVTNAMQIFKNINICRLQILFFHKYFPEAFCSPEIHINLISGRFLISYTYKLKLKLAKLYFLSFIQQWKCTCFILLL